MERKTLTFGSIEEMLDFIKSIKSGGNKDYSQVELIETITLKKFNGDSSELLEEIVTTNATKIL